MDQFRNSEQRYKFICFWVLSKFKYCWNVLPVPTGYHGHDGWLVRYADALESRPIDETVLQYYRRHNNNTWCWCNGSTVRKNNKNGSAQTDLYKLFCHSGVADLESTNRRFFEIKIIAKSKSDVIYCTSIYRTRCSNQSDRSDEEKNSHPPNLSAKESCVL